MIKERDICLGVPETPQALLERMKVFPLVGRCIEKVKALFFSFFPFFRRECDCSGGRMVRMKCVLCVNF